MLWTVITLCFPIEKNTTAIVLQTLVPAAAITYNVNGALSAHLQVPHLILKRLEGWRVPTEQRHKVTFTNNTHDDTRNNIIIFKRSWREIKASILHFQIHILILLHLLQQEANQF